MIQDVVTVTQLPDLNQLIFQAHSIDLWITDPVTHWVIVQDRSDIDVWRQHLSPFYRRHRLEVHSTLLPADQYDRGDRDGYQRQQWLKLMASQLIHADRYMVLDSKNFFWRTQSLAHWPTLDGRPILTAVNATGPMQTWMDNVAQNLGIESIQHTYEVLTPFVMTTEIAQKCCEFDLEFFWYELSQRTNYWHSEFVFYSWVAHTFFGQLTQDDLLGQPDLTRADTYYLTLSDMSTYQLDRWLSVPSNLAGAIHRDVIADLSVTQRNLLIDWFASKGFDRSIAACSLQPSVSVQETMQ